MKKYISDNPELDEIIIANGIDLTCNNDMDILVSDENAKKINKIVKSFAPYASGDYHFEDYEHTISDVEYESKTQTLSYYADGSYKEVWGEFRIDKNGKHHHTHIFDDDVELDIMF